MSRILISWFLRFVYLLSCVRGFPVSSTSAACVWYSWGVMLPSLILTRPLVLLRVLVRKGQKAWLASVGSLVNLQSLLHFQPLLSSYISPCSPCISFFLGTYLAPSRSTNYPLHTAHREDTAFFSRIFSPPPLRQFARKDKRKEGGGGGL